MNRFDRWVEDKIRPFRCRIGLHIRKEEQVVMEASMANRWSMPDNQQAVGHLTFGVRPCCGEMRTKVITFRNNAYHLGATR